jgi:hypothetical protein
MPARGKVQKAKTHKTSRQVKAVDQQPWPYVECRWIDATSESAWRRSHELPAVTPVVSRGWLVRQTKTCITLAASIASIDEKLDDKEKLADKLDCGEIITIPKGCIIPDGLVPLEVKRMKGGRSKRETLQ